MRTFGYVILTIFGLLLLAFTSFGIYFAVDNWAVVQPALEQYFDKDQADAEVPGNTENPDDTEQPGTGEEPGGTEDPEQPGGNEDEEPETPATGTVIEDFVFANGVVLMYTGDEDLSTIEIPESYSLSEPQTVTIQLNNEDVPIEQTLDEAGYYMLKLEFGRELKFNLKDGSSVLISSLEDWTPETVDNLYMNAVSCEVQEYDYLVGDDIQVYALMGNLYGNSDITSFTCPEFITKLYPNCFINCTMLTSVDLSNSGITEIVSQTFRDCFNLTTVYLPDTLVTIEEGAFENCNSLSTIYVPAELLDTYQSTYDNYTFAAIEA